MTMSEEEVLKKYELTACTGPGSPCCNCDAFDECTLVDEEPINPYATACCKGDYNLKLRNKEDSNSE